MLVATNRNADHLVGWKEFLTPLLDKTDRFAMIHEKSQSRRTSDDYRLESSNTDNCLIVVNKLPLNKHRNEIQVMHICIANFSQTVTDSANIAIANK